MRRELTGARRSVNIRRQSARVPIPSDHVATEHGNGRWQRKRENGKLVFETGAVRAVRPDRPLAPGHLVIEPIEAVESLLTLEDELQAELMTAVKRAAQEIVRVHGACRVHTDLGGHHNRLRWHVYAPPS